MKRVICVLAVALMAGGASAAFIGGPDSDTSDAVTATSPNANGGHLAVVTVNGVGLDETGEMHDSQSWTAGTSWLGEGNNKAGDFGGGGDPTPNPGTHTNDTNPNWMRFDFDAVYPIAHARIWNYNGELPCRGMNQVVVEYSTTGGGDPSDWSRLGGPDAVQSFLEATGGDDYTGFILDFGGVEASSVMFTVLENTAFVKNFCDSGNIGLSEVRFYSGTAIVCDPGDADQDGDVDDDDLSLLLANWGGTVDCTKGEFSGAAPVDDDDLSLLLANWTGSTAAVPEPATIGLIALGALALLRRKR